MKSKPLLIQLMCLPLPGLNPQLILFLQSLQSPLLPLPLEDILIIPLWHPPLTFSPLLELSSPAIGSCSFQVPPLLPSIQPNPAMAMALPLVTSGVDGLFRVHVPFSLSDLSQIEKRL